MKGDEAHRGDHRPVCHLVNRRYRTTTEQPPIVKTLKGIYIIKPVLYNRVLLRNK